MVQYAEVPSVDACETTTATDTTDDEETALGIVLMKTTYLYNQLFICIFVHCMGGDLRGVTVGTDHSTLVQCSCTQPLPT